MEGFSIREFTEVGSMKKGHGLPHVGHILCQAVTADSNGTITGTAEPNNQDGGAAGKMDLRKG